VVDLPNGCRRRGAWSRSRQRNSVQPPILAWRSRPGRKFTQAPAIEEALGNVGPKMTSPIATKSGIAESSQVLALRHIVAFSVLRAHQVKVEHTVKGR